MEFDVKKIQWNIRVLKAQKSAYDRMRKLRKFSSYENDSSFISNQLMICIVYLLDYGLPITLEHMLDSYNYLADENISLKEYREHVKNLTELYNKVL